MFAKFGYLCHSAQSAYGQPNEQSGTPRPPPHDKRDRLEQSR